MPLHIETKLAPVGPATAIELSDAQVVELGGGKRAAVLVQVGGRTARLRLARMGGQNLIGISKAARAKLGVEIGDSIVAEVSLDSADRSVELPPELAAALNAVPAARSAFDTLSYTRRKEIARGVTEAKRPETRDSRIAAAMNELGDIPGKGAHA